MRIILYIVILCLAVESLWLLCLPLLGLYIYQYRAYELIVIAALLDGYVGGFHGLPLYTTGTAMAVVGFEWLRSAVMTYTE